MQTEYSKINNTTLGVKEIQTKTTNSTYTLNDLVLQRDQLIADKAKSAAVFDAQIAEANQAINEAVALGIVPVVNDPKPGDDIILQ